MFLKRIEMQGFKSFADPIVINFEHGITGVVGPNGCGKSNITDAVRWVLGEQSVKSMRGSSMSDIIFNGTLSRRKVNTASVTLVFDNNGQLLNHESQEIEVTRRIHRESGEGEYYINKKPVRLKDIQNLTLDSGIGKDSLSIISQGTISNFADAKPIERRALFEEQAGVSKYKKRKNEALGKLSRTAENIERMMDIVSEIERQVTPLKTASEKAKIYLEKQTRLETIEISVLVSEIDSLNEELKELKGVLFDQQSKIASYETNLNLNELQISESRDLINDLDQKIQSSQDTMMSVVNEIQKLEGRKTELDEKSKYILEVGNIEEKREQLSNLTQQAKIEYDDRVERYSTLKSEVELLTTQSLQNNREVVEANQKREELLAHLNQLNNRKNTQQQLIDRPFITNKGVSTILENKNALEGIKDVVVNLLIPYEGYELAISNSLGGSSNHIVTQSEQDAKHAIAFLKRNASGRATFIPLNTVKPRCLASDILTICENTEGYLGVASDFVENESIYDVLADSLLGNVVVADNIENANILARLCNYRVQIVTLEGDIFYRGGTIAGGKFKENNSILGAKRELEIIEQRMLEVNVELDDITTKGRLLMAQKNQYDEELMENRIGLAQIEPIVDVKRAKYEKLKADLELLDPHDNGQESSYKDDLIHKLNDAYQQRDTIINSLKIQRESRVSLSNKQQAFHAESQQLRRELSMLQSAQSDLKIRSAKIETKLENHLDRLSSEYQMTYEYAMKQERVDNLEDAKAEVITLRRQIQRLGAINMSAPEEYEALSERYEFLKKQLQDLEDAKSNLLELIDELDEIMKVQFKEMFDKINNEFDGVFKELFGGGHGRLVLEDEEDLLNTGVDIDVQPPGKSIQNIRLFSGGEKSLIAISVLFAILKARRVPLCIFDEVEAALDQANVERFARYIGNFSDTTQFIVITHRPGTMAQCDTLYGVTMAQKGISSLLKVKLAQAIDFSEEERS